LLGSGNSYISPTGLTTAVSYYAGSKSTEGCASATRATAAVTILPVLAASTNLTGVTSICSIVGTSTGTTYTATAVTGAVSYLWTIPTGAAIDSGNNGLKIKVKFLTAGANDSIYVQTVGSNGCAGAKRVLKLVTTTCATAFAKGSSISLSKEMLLKVFPNPTTSNFNLQVVTAGKEEVTARVLDMQGRFIKSVVIAPNRTINIGSELKAGAYFIEVRQGKEVKTTRVIKF